MTHSELLSSSVSECPSLLGLEFPLRESLGGLLEKEARTLRKTRNSVTQKLLSSRATERDDDGGMMLDSPPVP